MGVVFSAGYCVHKDYKRAVGWFAKAALQGDAEGQNNLGDSYVEGQGVQQNVNTAREWFMLAAAQDLAAAQFNLGALYRLGAGGLPIDHPKAIELFTRAAEQYDPRALYRLASCYRRGAGVKLDLIMALVCAELAEQHGYHPKQDATELRREIIDLYATSHIAISSVFIEGMSDFLKKYIVEVRLKLNIDANNASWLAKTFSRAMNDKNQYAKCLHGEAVRLLSLKKKIVKEDKEVQSKSEVTTLSMLPCNMALMNEYWKEIIDEKIRPLIYKDLNKARDIKKAEEKKNELQSKVEITATDRSNTQFANAFIDGVMPFLMRWIVEFHDSFPISLEQVPILINMFENFIRGNVNIADRFSQSTALAPLSNRNTLIYRAFREQNPIPSTDPAIPSKPLDVRSVIYFALTNNLQNSGPIVLVDLILDHLVSLELKADLKTSLWITPEVADAVSDLTYAESTALLTFKSKQSRNAFIDMNQNELSGTIEDAKVGNPLQGYSIRFMAQVPKQREHLKQKLCVVEEYVEEKQAGAQVRK